ncbi:MAG: FAD-dependent oxidoreductase, partial [Candidatus Margulisbacteria bacterium]|nr:FAD-dependent oxidoreductase [Candidatus Margulisiibacteriota bacterium]
PKPGGLNEYGLAAYKMVDDFAQKEVEFLLQIGGINIQYEQSFNQDILLTDLQKKFDAVFISVGLGKVNQLGIDGEDSDKVIDAIRFIENIRQAKNKSAVKVGNDVIVIGAGNTAIDAAIQAKRLGANNVTLVYRRSFLLLIKDGCLVVMSALWINTPWIYGQYMTHGNAFIDMFILDNIGRYFEEPGGEGVQRDYYGYMFYTILGMLPFSVHVIVTFFQKPFWNRLKADPIYQSLFWGFIPCLCLFSFSGHIKLFRYIGPVFPFLILVFSHHMIRFDLDNLAWLKRLKRGYFVFMIILTGILASQLWMFSTDAKDGIFLTFSLILLLFSLTFVAYVAVSQYSDLFQNQPEKLLLPIGLFYLLFFTAVTYDSFHAPFLMETRHNVEAIIK